MVAASDGPPAIVGLAGDGDLQALVRVIVTRTGLNFRRDQKLDPRFGNSIDAENGEVVERMISDGTPAEDLAQRQARDLVKAAMTAALAQLEPRDRTLLRMHFVHRMSIDAIGKIYEVHRATAARWLSAICDRLNTYARRDMRDRLGTRTDHMDSLLGVMDTAPLSRVLPDSLRRERIARGRQILCDISPVAVFQVGMATSSIVVATLGALISMIPLLGMYAVPLTLFAIILGVLAYRSAPRRGVGRRIATASVILGVIGASVGIFQYSLYRSQSRLAETSAEMQVPTRAK